jgi:hypothetical protein
MPAGVSQLHWYGHNVHFVATCSSVQKVVNGMQSVFFFVHLPRCCPKSGILQSIP